MEAAASEVTPKQRGRILVVDDERMLCTTIERILSVDHEVTAVTSARQALQLVQSGERFDAIICDLMMPQMTGMDLHAALLRVAPDQAKRMAFMTGGAFSCNASAFLEQTSNPRIAKPFKSGALLALVEGFIR
jgi:CheY-like chemotaxis protein